VRERAVRAAIGVPEVVGLEALPATAAPRAAAPAQGGGATPARPAPIAHADEASKSAASTSVPEVKLDTEAPPEPPAPPADLLASAEQARHAGDYTQARELYRRAAVGTNVTAEAAWVALARMELSLGHAAQALEATKHRQERFGRGTLSPEALWIDVRSYRQMGDLSRAKELASKLVEQYPASPQARAAQQWLAGP
jgi:tetratricopeptide (TPR) repeat protein